MSRPLPSTSVDAASFAGFDETVAALVPIDRLERETGCLRDAWRSARPYPHLVLDGFFDPVVLDRVVADFPDPGRRDWSRFDTIREIKEVSRGIDGLSPFTQMLCLQLCSTRVLAAIRAITGMPDLVADPMFLGAGLHETARGGWLNLHADFTGHDFLPLARRLNLIVYLNRGWHDDWGGALELHGSETSGPGARIAPVFNRAILFPTTPKTLHGFPAPLTCPAGRTRQSISVYYWSADRAAIKDASAIRFLPGNGDTRRRALVRAVVPPAALQAARLIRRRLRR